eukprot:COSAG01_NODE_25902_length_729_cov_9.825397_1_plen_40_part_01
MCFIFVFLVVLFRFAWRPLVLLSSSIPQTFYGGSSWWPAV